MSTATQQNVSRGFSHKLADEVSQRVLECALAVLREAQKSPALSEDVCEAATVRLVMRTVGLACCRSMLEGSGQALTDLRLLGPATPSLVESSMQAHGAVAELSASWQSDWSEPEIIGHCYERLLAELGAEGAGRRRRKQTGSFFTPPDLARKIVERALEPFIERARVLEPLPRAEYLLSIRLCDPAMGAGVFLLQAARALAAHVQDALSEGCTGDAEPRARRAVVAQCVHGVDADPDAVAVAELALFLFAGDRALSGLLATRLIHGDALPAPAHARASGALPVDFDAAFGTAVVADRGFDLVIGNPPWVAYAGRATQRLEPGRRAWLSQRFRAFRGYPTLHAVFVERAGELAPRGTIALLLPSPLADLDGYRAARASLTATHRVRHPLEELGQDAFRSVTQPCFALIADADAAARSSPQPWPLVERQHAATEASAVPIPAALLALLEREPIPRTAFREMGFQTSRQASQTLLLRAAEPDARHSYPLLEGRDVRAFQQRSPRLFLRADPELLRSARCRVRPAAEYREVEFVVRQTASFPIAALHSGVPFRNTLLAGFGVDELTAPVLVALLNSSLYRALHVAARRDARQAAFPQVKIAHLRALPRPPHNAALLTRLAQLTELMTRSGSSADQWAALDATVCDLFGLDEPARTEIAHFAARRIRAAAAAKRFEQPDTAAASGAIKKVSGLSISACPVRPAIVDRSTD